VRLVLFEKSIKRQSVLHFGGRQLEYFGYLDNGLEWDVAQRSVHDVNRGQCDSLLVGISRQQRFNLLDHLPSQHFEIGCIHQ
jgi:hypothetical protein